MSVLGDRPLNAARSSALRRVAVALALFACIAGAHAAEALRMVSCGAAELTPRHLDYALADDIAAGPAAATGALSERFADAAFSPAAGHRLNFGQVPHVLLRFSVVNEGCDGPVHLDLGNPFVNSVRVHRRAAGADWQTDSDQASGAWASMRLRYALHPLALERGVPLTFVVEIGGPAAILVAPSVVGGIAPLETQGRRMALGGVILGAILALGAYCALLGAFTRFSGLVAFSVSALALGGFYAMTAGMLDYFLIWLFGGVDNARAAALRVGAVFVLGAALSHWIFVRRLLGEPKAGTMDDRWVPALFALWAAVLIAVLMNAHAGVARVSVAVALITIAAIVGEVVRGIRARHALAPITLGAFASLALAAIAYVALVEGLLPGWGWVVHVLGVGILIESLLLAIAVAAQVRSLRGRHRRLAERTNELALLSRLDPLTGLGNRRAYDATVSDELARCQRRGRVASLLVIDIDHFKKVNDSFGHDFGDSVIRVLGVTIANCVRTDDRAYRYGGEEFVVLLPNLGAAMAREVGERVMREFSNCSPTAPDGKRPFFSVSIGLAQMQAHDDARTLFARADLAMYRAKQNGRCRLETSDDPVEPTVEPSPATQ